MDRPDVGLLAAEEPVEQLAGGGLGRVAVAHHPGQAVAAGEVGGGGQGVDLLLVDQLQPVLHRPQQAVGGVEGTGVGGVDVAAGAQLGQGVEGGG